MSEAQQLNQLREQTQAESTKLQLWVDLKKKLTAKFKTAHEAYVGLKKKEADVLTVADFAEYTQGQDISQLFKDESLTEENFIKIWEQWEFKLKQNEHKLQMIDEKLDILGILDQPEGQSAQNKGEGLKKKQLVNQLSNCDSFESLQSKLSSIVLASQKEQHKDLISNESECFSSFLGKKQEQKPVELYVSKIVLNKQEGGESNKKEGEESQLVESIIIAEGKPTFAKGPSQTKKSYIDSNIPVRKQKATTAVTFTQRASYIGVDQSKQPVKTFMSPNRPQKPQYEETSRLNPNAKAKKMKNEMQHYISELFQYGDSRPYNNSPQALVSPRGLSGLGQLKRPSTSQNSKLAYNYPNQGGGENQKIQRRVQNIRSKLNDLTTHKSPQRPVQKQTVWTPDRPIQPRGFGSKTSPQYTPGNTKRLNLDRLKQEKQQEDAKQSSSEKPQQQTKIETQKPQEVPKQPDSKPQEQKQPDVQPKQPEVKAEETKPVQPQPAQPQPAEPQPAQPEPQKFKPIQSEAKAKASKIFDQSKKQQQEQQIP